MLTAVFVGLSVGFFSGPVIFLLVWLLRAVEPEKWRLISTRRSLYRNHALLWLASSAAAFWSCNSSYTFTLAILVFSDLSFLLILGSMALISPRRGLGELPSSGGP